MEKGSKQDSLSPVREDAKKRRPPRKMMKTFLPDEDGELITTPMLKKKGNGKRNQRKNDERKSKTEDEPVDVEPTKDKQRDVACYVAQSALILPFNVKISALGEPINMIITERLLSREIKYWSSNNENITSSNLWRMYTWEDVPPEVGDLNILFRQHVVWSPEKKFQDEKTWTCRRFVMNDDPRTSLFDKVQIHTIQNGQPVSYQGRFSNIELLLFPMGCLIVVIHVDWIPTASGDGASEHINLSDVRTLFYVSKYRDKVEAVCDGWTFKVPEDGDDVFKGRKAEIFSQVESSLGRSFCGAKYFDQPISLRTLCYWLVSFAEDPRFDPTGDAPESSLERSCSSGSFNEPIQRTTIAERPIDLLLQHRRPEKVVLTTLEHTRHAIHHSTVVLEHEIPEDMLHEYLFHLKRAFGQKNRPPPETSIGRELIWRKNRYIGTSREGTVSLSWPSTLEKSKNDFEVRSWHRKFQGIYLTLFLFVLGERMVFLELSDLASSQAEKLRFREDTTLAQMKGCRDSMRNLATRMVRYTLSMCSDVGGISEYSEFFSVIRQVFAVPDLRNELSNELKDVLAAVESNYLEEERTQRENEEKENRIRRERHKREQARKNDQDQQFAIVSSLLGALTIPFVLITGIFGMNLSSLPDPNFVSVILVNLISSGLIFLVLMVVRFGRIPWFWKSKPERDPVRTSDEEASLS